MTSDSGYELWPDAAFDGERKPAPSPPRTAISQATTPQMRRPRPTSGVVVASGVAIALALGLGVGYLAQPELGTSAAAAKPMAPVRGARQELAIEPGAPQAVATATARPTDKLQVLPPDMVQRARLAAAALQPASAVTAARDVSDVAPDPGPQAPVQQAPAHLAPPAMAQAPPRAVYPAPPYQAPSYQAPSYQAPAYPRVAALDGPCAGAASRAAQIVCSDPELSAADRALNRAYRRAMRSGALPPEQLRADQQGWLAAREDAARRAPRALAGLYDRRIDELNALADEDPD